MDHKNFKIPWWGALLILLALGVAAFANGLRNPFMLDDYSFFDQIRSTPNPLKYFSPPLPGQKVDRTARTYYRPLAHFVPHISYAVFGKNPLGHHALNLVLFVAAAFCVYALLSALMPAVTALTAAVFFLLHPINGVMVNYVTASVFSVQVAMTALCLIFLLRLKTGCEALSALCFILALLCHETAVMIPCYALIVCWVKGRDKAVTAQQKREFFRRVGVLWILLILYALFRSHYVSFTNSLLHSLSIVRLDMAQAMASILNVLGWYANKLVFPKDIFLMWSAPFVRQGQWEWVVGLGIGIVVFVVTWKKYFAQFPLIFLFFVWFLLGLLPLGLGAFASPYMGAFLEPHWFAAGGIGFFAVLSLLMGNIKPAVVRYAGIACLSLALLCGTWANNRLWGDEVRYYARWLEYMPRFAAAHYFLGLAYKRQRQFDKAREAFRQAVIGRYKDWMVYLNLAQMDIVQERFADAKANAEKAYALEPRQVDILNVMGAVAAHEGKHAEAREFFVKAAQLNPLDITAQRYIRMLKEKRWGLL